MDGKKHGLCENVESTTTDNNLSNANFSQSGLNRFEDDRFGNDRFGNDRFEDDQFGIDQFGNDRLQENNLNQFQFQENNLNQNQFQDDNSNQNRFHNDNLIEIDLQDDNSNQNHLRDDNLIEINLQDDNLNQNQLTEDRLNENDPKPKTQSKKALQASQRLAKRPAKPLPALNANDVKKRKSIENSLKESSSERLKFYEEQIKASTSKQDKRAQAAANAAAAALEFKQKKWDLQLEREDAKMASESMRALQITKLNNENEERKARQEAIERCHKEDMPMEQMKEYIAFLFPPSDKV
ncbi:hypothetical protein DFH28DRAFT_1148660 [Melampsora americana]|nr:hypothetical protein DFH28DRAFT_1148660 [Melampsora americana]